MAELAQSLGGVERHALDWYRTSEEAKETDNQIAEEEEQEDS